MSSHKGIATLYREFEFWVEFTYHPGSPDVMYLRNGDPGYPGDPEEIEIHEVWIVGGPTGARKRLLKLTNEQLEALESEFDVAQLVLDDLDTDFSPLED